MFFELWDIESGNLMGSFDSEDEALALVRAFGRDAAGRMIAESFVLGRSDDDGEGEEVAAGSALIALAESRAPRIAS